MKTFYYEFADGFYCYSSGRLPKCEKLAYVKEHGTIVVEQMM